MWDDLDDFEKEEEEEEEAASRRPCQTVNTVARQTPTHCGVVGH